MKRIISILVVTVLLAAAFGVPAHAAGTVNVTVTIWDGNGNAAVAYEALSVNDTDGDGAVNVGDVLSAAHDRWYEGGANAGYDSAETEWGLSLTRLWGDSSGSYGYYINNQMSMSLADPVRDGDYVAAFIYQDKTALSDLYAFVQFCPERSGDGRQCFAARYIGWDEDWNPVASPVVGANVYIDGKDSGAVTDKDGYALLSITQSGDHIITVKSEETTYACAISRITVAGDESGSAGPAESAPPADKPESAANVPDSTAPADSGTQAPGNEHAAQTGDASICVAALLALSAFSLAALFKKRSA